MSVEVPSSRSPRPPARREPRELNSVGNVLALVETLAQLPDAGISELSRSLSLSKPSVDRLLVTLVAAGFAEQSSVTKRYRLTPKIIALADAVRSRTSIIELSRPHLEALGAQLSETINLAALAGASVAYLHTVPSREIFRVEPRPGTMLPAYCTGLGKALLSCLAPEALESVIADTEFEAVTAATITSADRLRTELARAREDGYAVDDGEISEDVGCVAVPIRGGDGTARAAVSAMVPRSRFEQRRDELIVALRATAEAIGAETAVLEGRGR